MGNIGQDMAANIRYQVVGQVKYMYIYIHIHIRACARKSHLTHALRALPTLFYFYFFPTQLDQVDSHPGVVGFLG